MVVSISRRIGAFSFILLFLLAIGVPAISRADEAIGSIKGKVLNDLGNGLPAVNVAVVTDDINNPSGWDISNFDGEFEVLRQPAGKELTVYFFIKGEGTDSRIATAKVTLTANQTADLGILKLKPAKDMQLPPTHHEWMQKH